MPIPRIFPKVLYNSGLRILGYKFFYPFSVHIDLDIWIQTTHVTHLLDNEFHN